MFVEIFLHVLVSVYNYGFLDQFAGFPLLIKYIHIYKKKQKF